MLLIEKLQEPNVLNAAQGRFVFKISTFSQKHRRRNIETKIFKFIKSGK